MKLQTRFIVVIATVLTLVMGITTYLFVLIDERRTLHSALTHSATVMTLVQKDIRDVVVSGKSLNIGEALEGIRSQNNIISLRLLSSDGSILASNVKDEVGAKSRSYLLGGYKGSGEASLDGSTVTLYRPLTQSQKCQGCHDGGPGLGDLLEMTFDIGAQRSQAAATGRFLVVSNAVAVLAVAGILILLLNRHVLSPVGAVLRTIRSVEQGNWDERIKVKSNDDISALGASLNRMFDEMSALSGRSRAREREIAEMRADLEGKHKLEDLNSKLSFKVKELEAANKTILTLSREVRVKNDDLGRMVTQMQEVNEVARKVSSLRYPDEIAKLLLKSSAEMVGAKIGSIVAECDHGDPCAFAYNEQSGVQKVGTDAVSSVVKRDDNGLHPGRLDVPLKIKGSRVGTMRLEKKAGDRDFTESERQVAAALAGQATAAIENAWLYQERRGNFLATLQSLVGTLESSEGQVRGHSERVRLLSVELARHLHLEPEAIESLEYAALLHDVGKAGLDSRILAKAGSLSEDELTLVRSHPLLSDEILGVSAMFNGARAAILQHHEHIDGSGFPFGLKGDQITLKARILRVTDLFDVMVTEKPYRRAIPVQEAMEQILRSSGSMLDPYIAKSFVEMMREKDAGFLLSAGYEHQAYLPA